MSAALFRLLRRTLATLAVAAALCGPAAAQYTGPSIAAGGQGATSTALATIEAAASNTHTATQTFATGLYAKNITGGVGPRVGGGSQIANPPSAPTVTSGATGTLSGVYQYCYTETDGTGETQCSPAGSITLNGTTGAQVAVPMPRRGVSGQNLYRTVAGGSTFLLVHTYGGGYFQNVYNDNTPDGSLGRAAPAANTTALYNFEANDTVKFLRTNPSQGTGPADLTVLTGDSGYINGALAIDAYSTVVSRSYLGDSFYAIKTGNAPSGYMYRADWQDQTDGDPTHIVWGIKGFGNVFLTPFQLDDPGLGDSFDKALTITATLPSTTTSGPDYGNLINITGAGASANIQGAARVLLNAGFTGAAQSFSLEAENASANAGDAYALYGSATGAATTAVGVWGRSTTSTHNIAVGGGLGVDAGGLSWTGVVSSATALGVTNGVSTGNLFTGWCNTTVCAQITSVGNLTLKNTGSTMAINLSNTSGGGAGTISINSGTSMTIGSTNSIPLNFETAGTNAMQMDTSQNVLLRAATTALATSATAPFVYLPTMAGAPTGTPGAASAGQSGVVIDSTDHKLCWYEQSNTAWKCATGA